MTNSHPRLRGLLATLGLIAFVAGIPAVLLAIDATPDLSVFTWSRLMQPDDGTVVLEIIAVVAWVAWAIFTYQLIASIVSQIRGMRAPHLPGLVVPQLAADRFVAAAALLFVAVPSTTAILPPPRAEAALAATPLPPPPTIPAQSPAVVTPVHSPASNPQPATEHYTVRRGDSLWKIAEQRLGDGARYVELVDLNQAVLDGKPDFLLPGTILKVPIAMKPPEDAYIVQPGDTLSEIAQEELGDADAYPKVFEASRDTLQPDGTHLADPDLIRPGWTLTVPGPTRPVHPKAPTRVEPAPVPRTSPQPPDGGPPSGTPEPVSPPVTPGSEEAGDDGGVPLALVLPGFAGAGAAVAGCLWLVLRQHRRTQLRYRRPGTIIAPPPPELVPVEKSAHVTGSAIASHLNTLDAALRALPVTASVITAELAADRIRVTLADPVDLPAPWSGEATTRQIRIADVPPAPEQALAPCPMLVSVGQSADGAVVYLNFEELRNVAITGDAERSLALARHVVAELALNPWATLIHVDALGLAEELSDIDPGFVRIHEPGDIDFIHTLAQDLAASNPAVEPGEFYTAIVAVDDDPMPERDGLAAAIASFPARTATALITLQTSASDGAVELTLTEDGRLIIPSLGLDLAAAGLTPAEATATAKLVNLTREADIVRVPQPDEDDAVADIGGALADRLTRSRGDEPAGADSLLPLHSQVYADHAAATPDDIDALAPNATANAAEEVHASDPTLDEDLARWESPVPVAPKVILLGPVSARTMGDPIATAHRRPYYLEILAYLVLHPAGVTADEVGAAIGIRPKKARDEMSAIRGWLGKDRSGQPYLPAARQSHVPGVPGTYAVRGVLCDLDLFRRLRARGQSRGADGMPDLIAALRLVTGEPFTELRESGWSWLLEGDRLDHIMTSAIVDVAHIVTTHALAVGDLALAELASHVAVGAAPYDEIARLDAIEVRRARGDVDGAAAQMRDDVLNRSDDNLGPIDLPERTAEIVRRRQRDRRRRGDRSA